MHSSYREQGARPSQSSLMERGRKPQQTPQERLRKSHSLSTDRGRRPPPSPRNHSPAAGPIRAHHYSGMSFVRERSPHIAMDRLTRNVSPARSQSEMDDVINARIPQPYRTSFSAVTSPRRVKKAQSVRSPMVTNVRPNFIGGNPLGMSRGKPMKATANNSTLQNGSRSDLDESVTSQRRKSGSRDLRSWSRNHRSCDEMSDSGHMTSDRTESCDTLDGRDDTLGYTAGFDNRRLNPKYSSTPTRLPTSPLVSTTTNGSTNHHGDTPGQFCRLQSNDTLDSVFMPSTPRSPLTDHDISLDYAGSQSQPTMTENVKDSNTVTVDEASVEISKPPDSGYVEGRVEKRTCVEREYVHIVEITHEDLMKEKKKKRLPEANEETVSLVREMMNNLERRLQSRSASAPGTPLHSTQIGGFKKKHKDKNSLGKKSLSSSITNFFRKITQSPQTLKKDKKKKGKRSKSAGRLEGNRSIAGSNSSLGYRDISLEPTSTGSSDQSAAVLQGNHSNRPIRDPVSTGSSEQTSYPSTNPSTGSSSKNRPPAKSTSYLEDKENSMTLIGANNKLQDNTMTTSNNTSHPAVSHNNSNNKPNMPSTRVYLKSIEDNNTIINRADERGVYRTFKEKQSPSYRRHGDVVTMKSHAVKVMEVAVRGGQSGECMVESYSIGSDHTVTTHKTLQTNTSKVSVKSSENGFINGDREHLQNGGVADVHTSNGVSQQKSPSYLKLSCAISGYKNYGSQTKPLDGGKQSIQVTTNNNVMPHNGSSTCDEGLYSPTGSSYVKGLSHKFETLNSSDNSSLAHDVNYKHGVKPKSNSVSPLHTGKQSGAINSTQRKDLNHVEQSQALPKSINDPSVINDEVDSQNIDFKQARLAFDSQPIRSAETSSPDVKQNAIGGKYSETVSHGSSNNVNGVDLKLDLGSLTQVNGVENNRSSSIEDETDNIASHKMVRTNLNSIENLDRTKDLMHVIQNGFIEEDISTPSHIRVEALRDSTEESTKNTGFSKSCGSLNSSQDNSSLSCQSSTDGLNSSSSSISKDGRHFLGVCEQEEVAIQQLCSHAERFLDNTLSDEMLGKVRAAIGKGNLLTTKKFKQFKGLCHQNLTQSEDASFRTTAQDLAGFWDMVIIQIEDVKALFKELEKLSNNGWKVSPKQSPQPRKTLNSTPKKKGSRSGATPMSAKAQEAAKARAEARRKLMEAKKAGRQQRKSSESEDVEIYVA